MDKLRKVLALMLALAMIFGLAACTSGGSGTLMEVGLHLHLGVLPAAPDVLRTLGYANGVSGCILRASATENDNR